MVNWHHLSPQGSLPDPLRTNLLTPTTNLKRLSLHSCTTCAVKRSLLWLHNPHVTSSSSVCIPPSIYNSWNAKALESSADCGFIWIKVVLSTLKHKERIRMESSIYGTYTRCRALPLCPFQAWPSYKKPLSLPASPCPLLPTSILSMARRQPAPAHLGLAIYVPCLNNCIFNCFQNQWGNPPAASNGLELPQVLHPNIFINKAATCRTGMKESPGSFGMIAYEQIYETSGNKEDHKRKQRFQNDKWQFCQYVQNYSSLS